MSYRVANRKRRYWKQYCSCFRGQ